MEFVSSWYGQLNQQRSNYEATSESQQILHFIIVHIPLCFQDTPFQWQCALQIRPGHMAAAQKPHPLHDDIGREFLGSFSNNPAGLHMPCTP